MRKFGLLKTVVWSIIILLLLLFYVYIFVHLEYGLQSIFDEGFYFLQLKPDNVYTTQTKPLALSGEVLRSIISSEGGWDVLSLRQAAFGIKAFGIVFLLVCSVVFIRRDNKSNQLHISSILSLMSTVLLMGLFVMPSMVISGNDILLFLGMLVLALCLVVVTVGSNWINNFIMVLIGFLAFFAILCSAPGGCMLLFLSFLFLVFFKGINKKKLLETIMSLFVGMVLGVLVMHFAVISIQGAMDFLKTALFQTTNGGSASHHSLSKIAIHTFLDIRDLVITVTTLCGISYLCNLTQNKLEKRWLSVVVGVLIFVVVYKWQVKPEIKLASIVTWVLLMSTVLYSNKDNKNKRWDDIILIVFLYLLPFGLAFGTNIGLLNKVTMFIVPWGVLIFVLTDKTRDLSKSFSKGMLVFVFAFVLFVFVRGLFHQDNSKTYTFKEESPIASMQLNVNQKAFYDEVYDILKDYGYKSGQDTLLAFCYNEMTVVAMDAVPYTNDQQPEEFLMHSQEKLVKPSFMILSEWDEKVLSPFFESLDWNFPTSYEVIKLKNNPDPNSGWVMTQSSLYCLKSRGIVSTEELNIE